ncbi:MAG: putative porin [Amoebophilaceae bacterium]|nr:putative porin [Amoebophilaceae bacterium]
MTNIFIWLQRSCLILCLGSSFTTYAETAEALFEEEKEKQIEANTTFFITPEAVKQNYNNYKPIDRSVEKIDRFRVVEQHGYNLQDLGNHKTAAQPIIYTLPKFIGITYGLSAYDFYFPNPQTIRYYATHKAYTHFNVILANLGSFIFDSCYCHRLFKNCHLGVNVRSTMTEKEWITKDDVKIVSIFPDFDLFAHVKTTDESYHLFTSFSSTTYKAKETGGIRSSKAKEKFDFKGKDPSKRYDSSLELLKEAFMENKLPNDDKGVSHTDLRRNLYLYHQYAFSEQIHLYHELINSKKKHTSIIAADENLLDFITDRKDRPKNNNESKKTTVFMHALIHEMGVKGDLEQLRLFYRLYYRLETTRLTYNFLAPKVIPLDPWVEKLVGKKQSTIDPPLDTKGSDKQHEHYLGLSTRLNLSESGLQKLYMDGAYLLSPFSEKYHTMQLTYQDKFFTVGYHSIQYKSPYIVNKGYSIYRKWNKQFAPTDAKQLSLAICYGWPILYLNPFVSFTRINNYIFYKKKNSSIDDHYDHCIAEPVQATTPADNISYGGNINFCLFTYFHIDNNLTFFKGISSPYKIFKGYIPSYSYTGRYYYAHQPFNKRLDIETGINVHFKALYYADGYDIIAQQFYRQNEFATEGRCVLDLFINFRIKNIKLFLKYSSINQDFYKPTAYFATPFYPGLRKAADIGVEWCFFD